MNIIKPASSLAGRILIATIFLLSGLTKISAYSATVAYMQSQGVPAALLPLVIATEIGGGLLIVLGLWTRAAAIGLAGFTVLAALLFHAAAGDPTQQIMFLKNVAIAGGFLFLLANGAGAWSLDSRRAATGT